MTTTEPRKPANLAELYILNPTKACRLALRKTRHLAANSRMDAINELLNAHGVEAIRGEWQNGYWCDIVATYVNMGDTYDTTVIHLRGETRLDNSRFFVGNWGDFVERNSERYGIQ